MKTSTFTLAILFVMLVTVALQPEGRFYYAFNEKVSLSTVENKLIIRYTKPISRSSVDPSLKMSFPGSVTQWIDNRSVFITVPVNSDKQTIISQL